MADAFRGLTIRLGADARPLNSAISSISRAASSAQKQLNAMEKALKFNPQNAAAMGARIELMGDKALMTARAAQKIKTAMSQVSSETKALAGNTKNAYADTQRLRAAYVSVDAELQHIYDSMARVVQTQSGMSKSDANEYVRLLRDEVKGLEIATLDAEHEFRQLLEQASKTKNINSLFKQQKGDVTALIATMDKLRAKHTELNDQHEAAKAAEGYKAMRTQLIAYEAELRNSAAEQARFKSELYSTFAAPGTDKLLARIGRIDEEIDQATAAAKRMDAAFRAMPDSADAARMKINATAAAQQSLNDKTDALRATLGAIAKAPGFDRVKAETMNVYKAVSEATEKCIKWDAAIARVSANLEELKLRQSKMDEAGVDKASADYEKLSNKIEKTEAGLVTLKERANEANAELAEANKYRRYRQTAEDLNYLEAELSQAQSKASALRKALDMASTFRTMGYGLYSTITPAIMIAGRYAIESAREVDSAYRDMRKTVNGTEEQFESLKNAALEFSMTHFTSADTILEIEAMGGQLGIAADSLAAFAETVANLDIATNMEADNIAEQLGKMASVINIPTEEYDNFGDALVRLGNNMPVMESDIMTVTTRFMGMGKVVNMTADQMLGWAAAASATGQKSEAAGSSMQRFISKVETAVVGGGEDLEKFAAAAEMSAEDFANAFRTDASDAMYQFIKGLGNMQKRGDSVNQTLSDLGINNVRDKQLLEGLANQMANGSEEANVLHDSLRMASDAYQGLSTVMSDGTVEMAGDAAREAGRKSEGFSGELKNMTNNAQVLASELAQGAIPIIKGLGDIFQQATGAIKAMPPEMKTAIVGVLGAVAALGPVAVGFGAVGAAIDTFMDIADKAAGARTLSKVASNMYGPSTAIKRLSEVSEGAAKGLTRMSTAVGAVAEAVATFGPVFAVAAAAIVALGVGISDAVKKNENFRQATVGMADEVNGTVKALNNWKGGLDGINSSTERMTANYDAVMESQAKVRQSIVERNRAAEAEISSLQSAKNAIHEYMNQSGLTAEQQGKLIAAIKLVNEQCNTQYQVMDAANGKIADEGGKLQETCAAIDQYIAKKQEQIRMEALAADYQEAETQKRMDFQNLAAQQSQIDNLKSQMAGLTPQSEEWNELNGYLEDAMSVYNGLYQAYKQDKEVSDLLAQSMATVALQADGASVSIGDAAKASTEWQAAFKGIYGEEEYASYLNEFSNSLNTANLSQEQFANLTDETLSRVASAWANNGHNISAALAEVGMGVSSLADQFTADLSKMGIDFQTVAEQQFGMSVDALAQKFNEAGISSAQLAQLGTDNFNALLANAGGDINQLILLLANMDGQHAEADATLNTNLAEEEAQADATGAAIEEIPDEGSVDYDDTSLEEAEAQAGETTQAINDIPESKDIDVNVYGNAQGVLQDIINKLGAIQSKEVTVTTNEVTVKHAAGGISSSAIRAIPRNADGGINGIVTRATLTNVGLVGEAGDEAVFHMRHAGGAIVPLSNRSKVRPFAGAVAAEMTRYMPAATFDADVIVTEIQSLREDIRNMKLYIDGRKLVGGIADEMDMKLSKMQVAYGR